jgi:hypothetical protein
MRIIPNQPIVFDYQSPLNNVCCDTQCFKEVRRTGDVEHVAVMLEPCEGEEGFVADEYENFGDWDFTLTEAFGSTGALVGTWVVIENQDYLFKLVVTSIAPAASLTVTVDGITTVIDQTGTFEFYVRTATTGEQVTIVANGDVRISIVESLFFKIEEYPSLYVVDTLGNIINQATLIDFTNGVAVYSFGWDEIECDADYQFKLVSNCVPCSLESICNEKFVNETCWESANTSNAGWFLATGYTGFFGFLNTPNNRATLTNESTLCEGLTYRVSFTLTNFDAGKARFRIELANGQIVSGWLENTLSYLFTFTPNSDTNLVLVGEVLVNSPSLNELIRIDNISVKLANDNIAAIGIDSQVIHFSCDQATCDNPEVKLGGCFGGFQFGFPQSFQPITRIQAAIRQPQYESDLVKYKNSAGRFSVPYASTDKRYTLFAIGVPEYLLDFIFRVWIFFDNAYVNSFTYAFADDSLPQITYPEQSNHGTFELGLQPVRQLVVKKQCNNFEAPCNETPEPPQGNGIGLLFQEGEGILFTDGDGVGLN